MYLKNNLRSLCVMACVVVFSLLTILIPAAAKTTITFSSWQFLEPSRKDLIIDFIKEFESKNSDIQVEIAAVPFSEYNEKLTTQLGAGVGPD